MDTKEHRLRILMFPWLGHGHISPYFELAKKLSERNFYIYFCSTPINLSSVRKQLDQNVFSNSIQLVELRLPSLPNLPPHYHTTKSLPSHLMSTLKKAFDMAEPSFSNILKVLKPDILIYDFIQPWAPVAASSENIPAIYFSLIGATTHSYFYDMCKRQSLINDEFPFSSIYLHEYEYNKIMEMFNSDLNKERYFQCLDASSCIILVKTCREIEAKYLGYFSLQVGKEFVPVGSLIPEAATSTDDANESNSVTWLNEKDQHSVVFVSFGSEYFLSKEEIEELAYGLELSKVNFIWVIRFPEGEKTKTDEVLPQGFFDRIGDRGIVIEDWAPQAKILAHSNVGGFVSHCGWSSVMEGIHYGVPIIAMPMHLDQPVNARLVVELGVGKEVKRENEKFVRREVAKVMNEVVVEKEGEEIRKKAKELSEMMKKKRSSEEEIDVVVEKLVQICQMSNKKKV